jgi:hypothetical protein
MCSPASVINDAFRQSFPLQHDLPPAMSALLTKLSALEANTDATALAAAERPTQKDSRVRKPQMV